MPTVLTQALAFVSASAAAACPLLFSLINLRYLAAVLSRRADFSLAITLLYLAAARLYLPQDRVIESWANLILRLMLLSAFISLASLDLVRPRFS
jgi:hypothetical protein